MSQENVEIVRRGFEALDRGDWDACARSAHADFECMPLDAVPGAAHHRGVEAVQSVRRQIGADCRRPSNRGWRSSSTPERPSSLSFGIGVRPTGAASSSSFGRSPVDAARRKAHPFESSTSARRPSKPPGSRSRRCRRRTWRSCGASIDAWKRVELDVAGQTPTPDLWRESTVPNAARLPRYPSWARQVKQCVQRLTEPGKRPLRDMSSSKPRTGYWSWKSRWSGRGVLSGLGSPARSVLWKLASERSSTLKATPTQRSPRSRRAAGAGTL